MNLIAVETNSLVSSDSRVQLTEFFGNDISPILVPGGTSVLSAIIVCCAFDGAATGAGGTWIRLSGAGLIAGEKSVPIAAQGGNIATGNVYNMVATAIPLGLSVRPDNIIVIEAETNVDCGSGAVGVTMVFE